MNKTIKAKWIRALRSGKYNQARMTLRRVGKTGPAYCCLGVLCEVIDKNGWKRAKGGKWHHHTGELLVKELQPIGMSSSEQIKLIEMNDTRKASFSEIAQWIKENL